MEERKGTVVHVLQREPFAAHVLFTVVGVYAVQNPAILPRRALWTRIWYHTDFG
jgi:hypothetical protein